MTAMPACDAEQEDDVSFRLVEFEDEEDADGDPQPSSIIDEIKGGVDIRCPECGSHWTVVNLDQEDEFIAIFLREELGARIFTLAKEGTFRHLDWRGEFSDFEHFEHLVDGGYAAKIVPVSSYLSEGYAPQPIGLESGTTRIALETGFVDVGLRYVDNDTKLFAEPPPLD